MLRDDEREGQKTMQQQQKKKKQKQKGNKTQVEEEEEMMSDLNEEILGIGGGENKRECVIPFMCSWMY